MSPSPSLIRILLVEDNPVDQLLIEDQLAAADDLENEITQCERLSEAIQLLHDQTFDIVLLDLNLPDSSGVQTFQSLHEQAPEVPVIIITGFHDEEVARQVLRQGAQDYLLKLVVDLGNPVARSIRYAIERNRLKVELSNRALQLERSEARVRSIIENNVDAMIVVDEDGFVLYANPAARQLFGDHCIEDQFPGFPLVSGKTEEFSVSKQDGTTRTADMRVTEMEWEDSPAFLATLRDITERKAVEDRLREQAALLDKSSDAIIVTDLKGRIAYCNKGAEKVYGWTSAETIGRRAKAILHPDGNDIIVAYRQLLEVGQWSGELEGKRKDGSHLAVESRWTLLTDDRGFPQSILIVNTDITERKNLQSQVLRSQRLESIGTLTSGIAHDFNNLLTVINGHTEIGLHSLSLDEDGRETLEAIKNAAQRAAALTSQLLAFSRKSVIEVRELDLNRVVSDLEKMLRRLIGEDIQLNVLTAPERPCVSSDPTHIEQIIMNLVVNARDAMPSGGVLTIQTGFETIHPNSEGWLPAGDYVTLSISDTGSGIPEDLRDRIFEPFFTTKKVGKGTGLGLSTVYGIVKQSQGDILLESEVGRGTTFTVYLPASDHAVACPAHHPPAEDSVPKGGETIILTEDEQEVRLVASMVLKSLGYNIIACGTPQEALEEVRKDPVRPHLLLTDVIMPSMCGGDLMRAVREIRPDIPVLFMSGYTDHRQIQSCLEEPNVSFLHKPFTTTGLADKVRKSLDAHVTSEAFLPS